MSSVGFLWSAAACIVAGLALYVTRGVLDSTVTADGVVRFAMLPPWQALVGFICLAALVLVGIDHAAIAGGRERDGDQRAQRDRPQVRPLIGFPLSGTRGRARPASAPRCRAKGSRWW